MWRFIFIFISFISYAASMYIVKPGPTYPSTKGEVWPQPQQENKEDTFFILEASTFRMQITNMTCTILTNTIQRYMHILATLNNVARNNKKKNGDAKPNPVVCYPNCSEDQDENYRGTIKILNVELTSPCEEYPYFEMNEEYELSVAETSKLTSSSIWGILRGLETFAQLFYISDDYNELRINATSIIDYPRYPHRGLLLDTSRHYITVNNILLILDGMTVNKMNVFHWHIVDDQSFPYVSQKFPNLSKLGAYHPTLIYTKENIEYIINYARDRGIRVIPEFDVPGHTASWGLMDPSILTKCYQNNEVIGLGPMNPINEATYKLIQELFQEVQQLFRDKFFHVGGDEVELDCWASNPEILQYMDTHNMSSVTEMHTLFMENTIPLLNRNSTPIVWQEVFDNRVPLSNNTIVQVWKNSYSYEMRKILRAGKRVLFSSAWYLDHICSDGSWQEYYKVDPRDIMNDDELAKNIVGGEACMWGEMADDRNVVSRIWPRASAVAERLWTNFPSKTDYLSRILRYYDVPKETHRRLEEHTCRMIRRGIPAQPPSGPGFCVAT